MSPTVFTVKNQAHLHVLRSATLKRKRSTSIGSERLLPATSITTDKVELASPVSTTILPPPLPPPPNNKSRSRRNNNRKSAVVQDPSVAGDGEDS